jgi:pSer/pThr/pTyr-binding forkhead associated (FHA) protein
MPHTATVHAKLLVKLHGQGSRTMDLVAERISIGRKADNDLAIDDQSISSHHARIIKVQSVFFIEDLKSTNGTSVNEKRIDRHQLRDADIISIGQHRLIFQDTSAVEAPGPTASMDMDQTMVLSGGSQLQALAAPAARLLVTSGKTDQMEYTLTNQVALIGSQEDAVIRLTGWFAPKAAARIARRGPQYSISSAQRTKKVLVNGKEVVTQQELKNGDQIEVAGVTLSFFLTPNSKTQSR